ncbi:nuclear transcription factor Y subunit C-3-like [Lolium rigidum]|uniref:nuclear transcription factor Y subunit C-3-like n=1 Tax=Lolium rigidum TaxID=89674 RepID=UPI001F5E27AD|nr:nuclear transcription factor Y subunit C-3-like [Lolium rigidum]
MRLARPYSGVFRGGATARTGPHALPLARIKKIMKRSAGDGSGGDGTGARMISGEAPVVFSRACELFVAELTRAAWAATLDGKRRTVHREDVAQAVRDTDLFDFLVDVVKDDDAGHEDGGDGVVGAGAGEACDDDGGAL